jgi:methanogenic corrinoid protein MtbC1
MIYVNMEDSARQLSLSLDAVAKALAEWTVTRHAEMDPSLPERYGKDWRKRWVADVMTRVRYLGQAIAVRRPKLFADTVAWANAAFVAREAGVEDLVSNLRCLREVLTAELPEAVGEAAGPYFDEALERLEAPAPPRPAERVTPDQPMGELTLRYLEAVLAGRRNDAVQLIVGAVESGTSVAEVYTRVLRPAQTEIGFMWHQNEISVADEHVATATTELVMSMIRPHLKSPEPRGRRVVATTVTGDLHAIGLRMVAEFLEMDGWDLIYLGANTPHEDVIRAIADHRADLLAVSVTSLLYLRDLGDLIAAVRAAEGLDGIKILVGGCPFNLDPDLWQEVGADGWAPSAEAAVEVSNRLVNGSAQQA